jgi:hypothetical protein
MRNTLRTIVTAATLLAAGASNAAVIGFNGGTATLNSGGTVVTSNLATQDNVKFYEESGFRIEFFFAGTAAPTAFSSNIGNYYGNGNAVIHAHWDQGDFGQVNQIKITKIDGDSFDMNYFVLTSNTATGGAPASGTEQAFIHASADGLTSSFSQMLPPEDWGFPATQVFLGSQFDGVKAVWFNVRSGVDCFGMDNFFINEEAPGTVSEPGSLALVGLALLGATVRRRRVQR